MFKYMIYGILWAWGMALTIILLVAAVDYTYNQIEMLAGPDVAAISLISFMFTAIGAGLGITLYKSE